MKTGVYLIAQERERQLKKGYTITQNSFHIYYELVAEAAKGFHQPRDRLSNLIKAGALIAAEIDRIQDQQKEAIIRGKKRPDLIICDDPQKGEDK